LGHNLNGRRIGIGGNRRRGGLAEDFEHDRAAGRAFAFDGFTAIFHRFLNAIRNFFLGLAFDAISFSHKYDYRPCFMPERSDRLAIKNASVNSKRKIIDASDFQAFVNLHLRLGFKRATATFRHLQRLKTLPGANRFFPITLIAVPMLVDEIARVAESFT